MKNKILFGLLLCPVVLIGQISGVVFHDYNGNGIRDNSTSYNEYGIQGITVTAYDVSNTVAGSTTTTTDGTYLINSVSGTMRIEFSWTHPGLHSSVSGESSVQFLTAPANNVNFGVLYPLDFSQPNPPLVTPTYVAAYDENAGSLDALIRFDYNAGVVDLNTNYGAPVEPVDQPLPISLANHNAIGTTWGLAYKRDAQALYSAAFMKRHAAFSQHGPGAIFKSDLNSNTTTHFSTIPNAGTDPHPIGTHPYGQADPAKYWLYDPGDIFEQGFTQVGKIGLGGLTIVPDQTQLLVVNLFDKKIYRIDATTGAIISSFNTPQPVGYLPQDIRPFALEVYQNKAFLGVTCTAESSQDQSDLHFFIYSFDPMIDAIPTMPVLDFPYYTRGGSNQDMRPWADSWSTAESGPGSCNGNTGGCMKYFQPWMTDIALVSDGSLVIGLRDRTADQGGTVVRNTTLGSTSNYSVIARSEIIKACPDGLGGWILENNGLCGGVQGANQSGKTEGPGGDEFFDDDEPGNGSHEEHTMAGFATVAGYNDIATIGYNPFDGAVSDGAIMWLNYTTGAKSRGYRVYDGSSSPNELFEKAAGLGDIEFLAEPAPLEIGNRVWEDTDNDGIQDPDEAGIDGIIVKLFKNGTQVGQTTTANGGQWYFNNATVTLNGASGLLPDMDYVVRVESGQFPTGLNLTTANVGGSGQPDVRDSDASLVSGNAEIAYTTGGAGENNHTLDIGFANACPPVQCAGVTVTKSGP